MQDQQKAQKQFFIHGLPRSGTAWLARGLTWGPYLCRHEVLAYSHARELFNCDPFAFTHIGCSETASAFILDSLMDMYPKAKHIVIVPNPHRTRESLARVKLDAVPLSMLNAMADKLMSIRGALQLPQDFSEKGLQDAAAFLELKVPHAVFREHAQFRVTSKRF